MAPWLVRSRSHNALSGGLNRARCFDAEQLARRFVLVAGEGGNLTQASGTALFNKIPRAGEYLSVDVDDGRLAVDRRLEPLTGRGRRYHPG
jgi:hypothetical protein